MRLESYADGSSPIRLLLNDSGLSDEQSISSYVIGWLGTRVQRKNEATTPPWSEASCLARAQVVLVTLFTTVTRLQ